MRTNDSDATYDIFCYYRKLVNTNDILSSENCLLINIDNNVALFKWGFLWKQLEEAAELKKSWWSWCLRMFLWDAKIPTHK